ncbi:ABC transporter ATP-binding protein [Flaviaesturariibacter flavus]|uniref:ABC transporter ATP-binding protein n=1 Tax=Flaviaesturariibacter flavus TaxID=2502780 RepID=A0A4R1B255_9BACT|nr:ABC transporter ATP-binding protein [Flaviaesturariibacter flavus]TCJ12124.1 ABC transporter ATP-binding protein [Flaviaesturariibacter flavus]
MIDIKHIGKRFKKLAALDDINASFNAGQVVALIGPNGSGKTTLIKTILGLVRPDGGSILFQGRPITEGVAYRSQIGYMPQIGRYPDNMTIGQLFRMIRDLRKDETDLDEEIYYQYKLDTIQDKPMRALSGGTRQKVSAALAFLFNPPVLILDEPTAGLDPLSSEVLKKKIQREKANGKLVLITSHVLTDLEEVTTDILYLQDGRILFNEKLEELQRLTGEEKLGKAIAHVMQNGLKTVPGSAHEFLYLKIAN